MIARRILSPLGVRLAAAFVTVAVAAIAVLFAVTVTGERSQMSDLVAREHRTDAMAAAAAAGHAFETAGGWEDADLAGAVAVAARGQATLTLSDAGGREISSPTEEAAEMLARMHGVEIRDTPRGAPVTAAVVIDGKKVGGVSLKFPTSDLPIPAREVRDALSRDALRGAVLAVLVAIAIAVFVARSVSRPVTALIAAASDMEAGRRDVRVDLADAPGELGTLAATFDRMAAAVQREDELRRRLVADVAHEVRTPLTILRGTTEALVDGITRPDPATLASLHDEVLRLARLVGDIETLAAADAAVGLDLGLRSEPVDLADVARSVIELARVALDDAELTLTTDLRPAPTTGDPGRLQQVTTNLVANAMRYTPAGGSITVLTETAGGEARLQVGDTGPGIGADELPHIFERFYRGAASVGTSGSGIGLAVASELVAAHGGRITVAGAPGIGTTFTVAIPSR